MSKSIIEARKEELRELKARKEKLVERRKEVQKKMQALGDSMDGETRLQMHSSSASARGNRRD